MKLSKGFVSALATHAGLTEGFVEKSGFVADSRIAGNLVNEFEALVPKSKAVMNVIEEYVSVEEQLAGVVSEEETIENILVSVSKNATAGVLKKAASSLKEKLEAKATDYGVVRDEDGVVLFSGTLNVDGDGSSVSEYRTYGTSLLQEIAKKYLLETEFTVLHHRRVAQNVVETFLNVDATKEWAMIDEFNANFSMGLASGKYRLGLGVREFDIKEEDSEEHKQALLATIAQHGLTPSFTNALNLVANRTVVASQAEQATVEAAQETVATEEASTMTEENVTITLAEYNSLKAIESVNDTNVALMAELNVKVKAYEDLIANLEDMLTEKDELIKSLEENTTNTEEEVNMSEFKITVKSFKEVEVRKTNEDKAVSMDAIDGMDVGAMIKARIKTVDVSKNVNNKIRENAPKAIVKVTNATHTGIDAVAVAAHKTTNVIAKVTNTTVLKSANAVDAVLDFVAPTKESTQLSAMKKAKANAKEGEVFEVNGSSYKLVNGSLIVQ